MDKPTQKKLKCIQTFVTIVWGFINILLYNTVVLWLYTIYFTKVMLLFTSLLFLNRAIFIYYTLMYQQNCTSAILLVHKRIINAFICLIILVTFCIFIW